MRIGGEEGIAMTKQRTNLATHRTAQPLPDVGSQIKLDYGPDNLNTWSEFGEVRAIVDCHIIVRRYDRHRQCHRLSIIDPSMWLYGAEYYTIRKPTGNRVSVTAETSGTEVRGTRLPDEIVPQMSTGEQQDRSEMEIPNRGRK